MVLLSPHSDRRTVSAALRAGVSGYVCQDAGLSELAGGHPNRVRRAKLPRVGPRPDGAGEGHTPRTRHLKTAGELYRLSNREREVVQQVAQGKSSSEIGQLLGISVRTVDVHRQNIMTKLGIRSIAGLTRFAVRHGLSPLE